MGEEAIFNIFWLRVRKPFFKNIFDTAWEEKVELELLKTVFHFEPFQKEKLSRIR